jgi:hypothetical protein
MIKVKIELPILIHSYLAVTLRVKRVNVTLHTARHTPFTAGPIDFARSGIDKLKCNGQVAQSGRSLLHLRQIALHYLTDKSWEE